MMTPKKILIALSLGLSAFCLTGCINLWQEQIDLKSYMLNVERDAPVAEQPLAEKLWIENVHVLPPYNNRNLIIRDNDVSFTSSYYSELLMSPAENFRNAFYDWFAESGFFEEVTLAGKKGMSHRLVITVMDFYGDREEVAAVLRLRVSLFDEKTDGVRVLFSKEYARREKLADMNAEELIRAQNRALSAVLAECEQDVTAALK